MVGGLLWGCSLFLFGFFPRFLRFFFGKDVRFPWSSRLFGLACARLLWQWLSRFFGAAVVLLMRTVVGRTGLMMVAVLCFKQDCPVKLAPVIFDLLVLAISGPRACVLLGFLFEALIISAYWSLAVWDFRSRLLRSPCFSGCCM